MFGVIYDLVSYAGIFLLDGLFLWVCLGVVFDDKKQVESVPMSD